MSNAVWFISYKLVKGTSVSDYLLASEKVHDEVLSRKKGFVSWQVLVDGDTWVDLVTWQTMEDAQNAAVDDGNVNPVSQQYYSYIDFSSLKNQIYIVKKSY